MDDRNEKYTPAAKELLGHDIAYEKFDDNWEYPSVIGLLLYLSSNSLPDIQFDVHQCARFNHCYRRSHAK